MGRRLQLIIQIVTQFFARTWFRVLFALATAYLIIFVFSLSKTIQDKGWNFCSAQTPPVVCLLTEFSKSFTLDNLESFSILVVALLYLLEGRDRKNQSQYEAWQILDSASSANVETSYARFKALQDLNEAGASLRGIDIPNADLEGINLFRADLREADLKGATLKGANLRGANLNGAWLTGAKLTRGTVYNAGVETEQDTDLSYADLRNVHLEAADLTGAVLNQAYLLGASLDRSTTKIDRKWLLVWEVINNEHQKPSQRRSNFRDEDFSRACLIGADLSRSNLAGANFMASILIGANFKYSNLTRANLRGAILLNADLTGARLIEADLTDAILDGAKFERANLTNAKFDRTQIRGTYVTNRKSLSNGEAFKVFQNKQTQNKQTSLKRKSQTQSDVRHEIPDFLSRIRGWFGQINRSKQNELSKRSSAFKFKRRSRS